MAGIGRIFVRGLVILVPLVVTVAILLWFASALEAWLGALLKLAIPNQYYIPGMGLAIGVLLVLMAGFLSRERRARNISSYGEAMVARLPVVNLIYGATRDIVGFVQRARAGGFDQVVVVHLGDPNRRVLGFVTRDDFTGLPQALGEEGMVAVYLPMSYQVGGYTVMLPRSDVQPVDLSVKDAMRYAITAGVSTMAPSDDGKAAEVRQATGPAKRPKHVRTRKAE